MNRFNITKSEKAQPFHCDRCNANKVSKTKVEVLNHNEWKIICNGCYGFLISKQKK